MAENNAQSKNGQESDEFTISNRDVFRLHWKVIALMATAILFLTTYFINNIINSPHSRIDKLVADIENHHKAIDKINEAVLYIKNDDANCIERQMKLEVLLEKQDERFDYLNDKVITYQERTKQRDKEQEYWIRKLVDSIPQ